MKNFTMVFLFILLFTTNTFGQSLISLAEANDFNAIQAAINSGQKDIPDELGRNALIVACYNNNYKIVELLIKSGSDVCAYTTNSLQFPLLIASRSHKNTDILFLLLNTNAKYQINTVGHDGFTPIVASSKNNNLEACKLLLKYGARKNIKTNEGYFSWEYSEIPEVQELLKQ